MKIEVTYYNWNGSRFEQVIYDDAQAAFDALQAARRDAMAHPVGTTCGAYEWRGRQDGHTLEGFTRKMEMCCNDPAEYSERLIASGLCAPHWPHY